MGISQSEELTLRQYLLGQLDADADITKRLEERILMEGDFAEFTGVIEDEIIEDYLEGALDGADREAVEEHFLRPRERQEKLRLARLVNRSLKTRPRSEPLDQSNVVAIGEQPDRFRPAFRPQGLRVCLEAVACILLIASFIYTFQLRHELHLAAGKTGQQLAAERERSGQLEHQLQALRRVAQPSTVMLSLIQPPIQRSRELAHEQAKAPRIQLGSDTQTVHVEIALQPASTGLLDVQLEDAAGRKIWTIRDPSLFRSGDAALLILDLPAQGIETGEYRLIVAPSKPYNGTPSSFVFTATRSD